MTNETRFKIGDKVTYRLTGAKCEIIADKNVPYDFLIEKISPSIGCDYVLKQLEFEGDFAPFIHTPDRMIELT
jgi:hypothetical protein